MGIFEMIGNIFGFAGKTASSAEDVADIMKAKSTAWKVESMKELNESLNGANMEEVHAFYESLYHKPKKKK